jgi:hypothetical protein
MKKDATNALYVKECINSDEDDDDDAEIIRKSTMEINRESDNDDIATGVMRHNLGDFKPPTPNLADNSNAYPPISPNSEIVGLNLLLQAVNSQPLETAIPLASSSQPSDVSVALASSSQPFEAYIPLASCKIPSTRNVGDKGVANRSGGGGAAVAGRGDQGSNAIAGRGGRGDTTVVFGDGLGGAADAGIYICIFKKI